MFCSCTAITSLTFICLRVCSHFVIFLFDYYSVFCFGRNYTSHTTYVQCRVAVVFAEESVAVEMIYTISDGRLDNWNR